METPLSKIPCAPIHHTSRPVAAGGLPPPPPRPVRPPVRPPLRAGSQRRRSDLPPRTLRQSGLANPSLNPGRARFRAGPEPDGNHQTASRAGTPRPRRTGRRATGSHLAQGTRRSGQASHRRRIEPPLLGDTADPRRAPGPPDRPAATDPDSIRPVEPVPQPRPRPLPLSTGARWHPTGREPGGNHGAPPNLPPGQRLPSGPGDPAAPAKLPAAGESNPALLGGAPGPRWAPGPPERSAAMDPGQRPRRRAPSLPVPIRLPNPSRGAPTRPPNSRFQPRKVIAK